MVVNELNFFVEGYAYSAGPPNSPLLGFFLVVTVAVI